MGDCLLCAGLTYKVTMPTLQPDTSPDAIVQRIRNELKKTSATSCSTAGTTSILITSSGKECKWKGRGNGKGGGGGRKGKGIDCLRRDVVLIIGLFVVIFTRATLC